MLFSYKFDPKVGRVFVLNIRSIVSMLQPLENNEEPIFRVFDKIMLSMWALQRK